MNHIINKQVLDITLDSEAGSLSLQSEMSDFFKHEIVPVLEHYFDRIGGADENIRFEKLEIDLGKLTRDMMQYDFREKLIEILPEKLAEAVARCEPANRSSSEEDSPFENRPFMTDPVVRMVDKTGNDYEVLSYFIKNGYLPWWVKKEDVYDIPALIEIHVKKYPSLIRGLLMEIAHNKPLIKRFIYHVPSALIRTIIAQLQNEHHKGICRTVRDLSRSLHEYPMIAIYPASAVTDELWATIISLCVDPGDCRFERRDIVRYVAGEFTTTFKIDYQHLFTHLADGMKLTDEHRGQAKERASPSYDYSTRLADIHKLLRTLYSLAVNRRAQKRLVFTTKGLLTHELPEVIKAMRELSGGLGTVLEHAGKKNKLAGVNRDLSKQGRLINELAVDYYPDPGVIFHNETLERELPRIIKSIRGAVKHIQTLVKKTSIKSILKDAYIKQEREEGHLEEYLDNLNSNLVSILNKEIQEGDGPRFIKPSASHDFHISDQVQPATSPLLPASPCETQLSAGDMFNREPEKTYVSNAGLVLLWPYLANFFETLGLIKDKAFIDDQKRERAVLLLHYLVYKSSDIAEHDLALNKIMCGLDPGVPVKPRIMLTAKEKRECTQVLDAVLNHWPVLKNTSRRGLQDLFLVRDGIISIKDGRLLLQVEQKAHDVLLDKMPWGMSMIKFPWSAQILFVEWRV